MTCDPWCISDTSLSCTQSLGFSLHYHCHWSNEASGWIEAAKDVRTGNYTRLDGMISKIEDLGSLEKFIEPWRFFQVHFDVSFCSGFTATMDLPMNLFASAMAERRPSSKVIMTVRPRIKWSEISFSWRSENFCFFVFLVPNFAGLKKSGCHHGPTWMTSCRF